LRDKDESNENGLEFRASDKQVKERGTDTHFPGQIPLPYR